MSTLLQLNYQAFQDLNSHAGTFPGLNALMIFCANLLIFCWPLFLLLVWGRPLAWRKRALRTGEGTMIEERRAVVLWVVIACILAYAFNLVLEHLVFEPHPFVTHHVHLLISHPADASFPSDHAAWSFAVVGMLLFMLPPALVSGRGQRVEWRARITALVTPFLLLAGALVIACSIGLARVFVGLHYPGDILGGALDGLLAAGVVTVFRHWLRRPTAAVLRFAAHVRLA